MKKKNLLLNPQKLDETLILPDEKDRELFNYVRDFFEHKGNRDIKIDTNGRRMPNDFYQLLRESKFFATLLTPAAYGDENASWDHYRLSAASELLGFYGFYQYCLQVSVLGITPIWVSKNEKQKKEAAAQLQEGNVFASGMTERVHGADLYNIDCTLQPIGDGKYIANGEKYYIGNSSRASKISVMGKNTETGEYTFWVVDSRDRHCKYCGDIETPGLVGGQLGHFEMIEYPLTDEDILEVGPAAFAMGFASINIGKTQTSISNNAKVVHMLYECVHHAHNRYLYGKRVTDMPHIRRMMLEAWCRLVMSRNFAYRAADYFRSASLKDRRFLLYNPLQKSYSAGQCEKASILMLDVMAAKAYEKDMFSEYVVGAAGMPVRLEGTAHVNLAQIVKFIPNYFGNFIDVPALPSDRAPHDDYDAMFKQGFGKIKEIRFPDYRRSFEGCELPNVKVYQEQVEVFRRFNEICPMTAAQEKNPDFMLNVGMLFSSIVFGQLFFEKAKLEGIEDDVIDACFSFIVRDNNGFAVKQLDGYAGHFEPNQKELLTEIIKEPVIDFDLEKRVLEDYVLSLDGEYKY